MARIVAQIGRRWPKVRVLLRADSGFAHEALMAWPENNGVDFLFGLAKNSRLVGEIEAELAAAAEQSRQTEKPARRFKRKHSEMPELRGRIDCWRSRDWGQVSEVWAATLAAENGVPSSQNTVGMLWPVFY